MLDHVASHRRSVSIVKPAATGLGQACASIGNDDDITHGGFL